MMNICFRTLIAAIFFYVSCTVEVTAIVQPIKLIGGINTFNAGWIGVPGNQFVIDIDNWDYSTLNQIADDIFPFNYFANPAAPAINTQNVIDQIVDAFCRTRGALVHLNHMSLVRVVVEYAGGRIVFPIPYIFVSGSHGALAVANWQAMPQRIAAASPDLMNAVANFGGLNAVPQIVNVVKGVGDYGFECSDARHYQFFAHSERAAILCLLYDPVYSLENIINTFNAAFVVGVVPQITKVYIQIKNIKQSCSNCIGFLNGNSDVGEYAEPNAFGDVQVINNAAGTFGPAGGNRVFPTLAHLSLKSGINPAIIHVRVSSYVSGF